MKNSVAIYILLLFSCTTNQDYLVQSQNWTDEEINLYCKSEFILSDSTILRMSSTSQTYYAFKAKDLDSNITKEICCDYDSFEGAIEIDSVGYKYDPTSRIHAFKTQEALEYIGFYTFDEKQLDSCKESYDLKQFISQYESDFMKFSNSLDRDCQLYYAYLLFKDKVISRSGSFAGKLEIMTNADLDKEREEMNEIMSRKLFEIDKNTSKLER
ncbi:hypothetical protein N9B82_05645 [Saprospiraceae bacterium]|nr:hypothetical protein [Saprospiraceae bacterium]